MSTTTLTIPVETKDVTCHVCGTTAPAIALELQRADVYYGGNPPRSDPARFVVSSWRSPEGWGNCRFDDVGHGILAGDLCPACRKKVGAALAGAGFAE